MSCTCTVRDPCQPHLPGPHFLSLLSVGKEPSIRQKAVALPDPSRSRPPQQLHQSFWQRRHVQGRPQGGQYKTYITLSESYVAVWHAAEALIERWNVKSVMTTRSRFSSMVLILQMFLFRYKGGGGCHRNIFKIDQYACDPTATGSASSGSNWGEARAKREFMNTILTKDSSLLHYAIHSCFYWGIFVHCMVFSDLKVDGNEKRGGSGRT